MESVSVPGQDYGEFVMIDGGRTQPPRRDVRQAIDRNRSQGRRSILMRMRTALGMRFVALPTG
jgi:hypothetical protein